MQVGYLFKLICTMFSPVSIGSPFIKKNNIIFLWIMFLQGYQIKFKEKSWKCGFNSTHLKLNYILCNDVKQNRGWFIFWLPPFQGIN